LRNGRDADEKREIPAVQAKGPVEKLTDGERPQVEGGHLGLRGSGAEWVAGAALYQRLCEKRNLSVDGKGAEFLSVAANSNERRRDQKFLEGKKPG
jgi:hypothetical protein